MKEADMDQVAGFIHEGIQIAVDANNTLAAQASSKGKAATNAKVVDLYPRSVGMAPPPSLWCVHVCCTSGQLASPPPHLL